MIVNFCTSMKFQTRLSIKHSLLEQVHEVRLLGVVLSDTLRWHANPENLVNRAYKRLSILRKLNCFNVAKKEMLHIYKLYIRSVIEQSSVVWSAALTKEEQDAFERCQKISLKLIYKSEYVSYENALSRANIPKIS